MKLLPDFILSAIGDGQGNTSVGRLIALLIVVFCVLVPAIFWAFLSGIKLSMQEVPGSYIGFMSAAGTLAATLYAITKKSE